jgi:hypothetical protein
MTSAPTHTRMWTWIPMPCPACTCVMRAGLRPALTCPASAPGPLPPTVATPPSVTVIYRQPPTALRQQNTSALAPDACLVNGGAARAALPAGNVTVADVLTALPFSNTLVVKRLRGLALITALENGLSSSALGKGGLPSTGEFPQVRVSRNQKRNEGGVARWSSARVGPLGG